MSAAKPKAGYKANAYLVFDGQGATNFKFAGIDVAGSKAQIGRRTAAGWEVLATANLNLKTDREYQLKVIVSDTLVKLYVDGVLVLSYTFPTTRTAPADPASAFVDPLGDGFVGVGASASVTLVKDMGVSVLAPTAPTV
jgi:hypothetical protein